MNYRVITFSGQDKDLIQKFLDLPKRLYAKKEIMQQPDEERKILEGTHVLNHYFTVFPLLVLNERDAPVSRAVLTVYPDDRDAYLGFFESENDQEAASLLIKEAEAIAKTNNCTKITGPIDASFWIRYRFKTNCFDRSYTGEPYNKDYYCALWQKAGFEIAERYYSNHYRKVNASDQNSLFSDRLARKLAEGYLIESPSKETLDKALIEVYELLIELYQSFPAYKRISREEFISLYSYLKLLIRYPMVKMAYYQGKAVGFFISIPDYGNAVYGRLTSMDYLRILRIHVRPRSYVMLYMGIDASHHGLGKAMAESIKEELQIAGVPSVGALIRHGNINKDYFHELIDYEYEYVLLRKELTSAQHAPQHAASRAQQDGRHEIRGELGKRAVHDNGHSKQHHKI